ncbi:acrosin-binding protein [Ascaphus truei]|uniref:acrosin-binding protein n=1 Tax=Ascaphus truei TaxID=8439 RepID=UPI003F5989D9
MVQSSVMFSLESPDSTILSSMDMTSTSRTSRSTGSLKYVVPASLPPQMLGGSSSLVRFQINQLLLFGFNVSGLEPISRKPQGSTRFLGFRSGSLATPMPAHSPTQEKHEKSLITNTRATLNKNQRKRRNTLGATWSNNEEKPGATGGQKETEAAGSLQSLHGADALPILCHAILFSSCTESDVARVWKQAEEKILGYGDTVCDSLGRRHKSLCALCAFCSLKVEQCRASLELRRVPCGQGTFTPYLSPHLSTLSEVLGYKVGTLRGEAYGGITLFGGLSNEFWCARLAVNGCDDVRVTRWLLAEYSAYELGDFPEKICDTERAMYPHYCSFKSRQCLIHAQDNTQLSRTGCLRGETYRVRSIEEAERDVIRWSQQYEVLSKRGVTEKAEAAEEEDSK